MTQKCNVLLRIVLLVLAVLLAATPGWSADPPDSAEGAGEADPAEAILFEELPVVEAASLHTQTLREAPANVTIISADDIQKYGYRTLGEALSNVRGFYVSDDRTYHYMGLRGFSLPGDYATRVLVMINGHYLPDNIYRDSGWLGQDFWLDMDLVKRIEIIRGPSSALYGSNGIFATINIVTKSPVDHPGARVSSELGNFGEKKIQVSSSTHLGGGANLLVSGSTFRTSGESLYFEEFDTPDTNFGIADGVGKQRGYHAFANLIWRDWSFTALSSRFDAYSRYGWYGTIFNDTGNMTQDGRSFLEAAYSRSVGTNAELRWRFYYDKYRYWGRYDYDYEDGIIGDNRDLALGDWVGSRLSYSVPVGRLGTLTCMICL